jgi:hypothetical protein
VLIYQSDRVFGSLKENSTGMAILTQRDRKRFSDISAKFRY